MNKVLKWQQWNRAARKFLWVLALVGVIASIPIAANRWQMESTSKQVEYVFDYSDLVNIAAYQAKPKEFLSGELEKMKAAGVTTMSVFESRLDSLETAGRLTLYNESEAALLQRQPIPSGQNFSYVLFKGAREKEVYEPMIRERFEEMDEIPVRSWSYENEQGLIIETPLANALLKAMNPDPLSVEQISQAGFQLLPRMSDQIPYDQRKVDELLAKYKELGVTRILFDGDSVKGVASQGDIRSLDGFAELLTKYGIGVAAVENLKKNQKGLNTLAYKTQYNVVRLHSLSDGDAAGLKKNVITDRFLLAAKDRNIRMFYLNGAPSANSEKGKITNPLDNLYISLGDKDGAVKTLEEAGFKPGKAEAFQWSQPDWFLALRAVAMVAAISLIALLAGSFVNGITILAFLLGLAGSAGLYVMNSSTMEQALALGAAVAAPALALIWIINRVYAHTDGPRRAVGGEWARSGNNAGDAAESAFQLSPWGAMLGGFAQPGTRWVFQGLSASRRFSMTLAMFAVATLISLLAVPIVIGLLNDITYSLVLEQFRGVNVLAAAPIVLAAVYLFLFAGGSVWTSLRRILGLQITILWVAVVAVLGVVGMYYLSRTGNSGVAPGFELAFRSFLETTFGVRPRTKEFLFAHPLLLLGIFLSLRYRAAWVLLVVGTMGQLSMVGTFTHLHTPLWVSLTRVLLGLGLGVLIGLILIAAWQVAETLVRKWLHKRKAAVHG